MEEFNAGVAEADRVVVTLDPAVQALAQADLDRIRNLPPIPKKKKPELEPGELEDEEMVVTDEWIEHANETLKQKEH